MKSLDFILLELESHWGWISGEKIETHQREVKLSDGCLTISPVFICISQISWSLWSWSLRPFIWVPQIVFWFSAKRLVNFSHAVTLQNGSLSSLRRLVQLPWKHNFTTVQMEVGLYCRITEVVKIFRLAGKHFKWADLSRHVPQVRHNCYSLSSLNCHLHPSPV